MIVPIVIAYHVMQAHLERILLCALKIRIASSVRLLEVDLFAEALRKPDPESFETILAKQKKSQEDAFKAFEEKVKQKDLPEVRPEDRPDYWR